MLTPERAAARAWIANWWPRASRAEAMLRDWAEVFERKVLKRSDTLPLADLARYCNAGDTSLDKDPYRLAANEGRREVWLHIRTLMRMDEDDTDQLLQETENE